MRQLEADRFGIGWRSDLAAGILANLDAIDVVEVLAEDWWDASPERLGVLQTVAREVPVALHAVSMGLASRERVEQRRLDAMARLVGEIRPAFWSEHAAFVRAGGVEIGHLAAPPRRAATIEGSLENLARARETVGAVPFVENVATLLEPPGSDMSEAEFMARILDGSGAPLLLDLHNLHANATNFGFDPLEYLDRVCRRPVGAIHLAGGRLVQAGAGRRILDDHLHPTPPEVFALLEEAGRRIAGPVTVFLERDGRYPPMTELLAELRLAREALARGRGRRSEGVA